MPSEQELLACPFCGNDGSGSIEHALHVAFNEHDWRDSSWTVQCDKCTATMGYSDSEDEAIAAWNTRATFTNQKHADKALDEAAIMEAAERVHAAHMAAHMRLGGDLTAWTWEEASKSFYRNLAIAALTNGQANGEDK